MIERRNFYRILHVQPDASMAVIKENYRVLMQKLKLHPDLGGPEWSASLLNIAYSTLKDPIKRAAYDQELLKRYHIRTLSQGALGMYSNPDAEKTTNDRADRKLNQRNYYRILQVQPDSPIVMIAASYRALKKDVSQDIALLDEAYRVLSDPAARQQYDVFFASKFSNAGEESAQESIDPTGCAIDVINSSQAVVECYRAVVTDYCSFCKTPYVPQTGVYQNGNCLECVSPLPILERADIASTHRTLMRIDIKGEFVFYSFWPGKSYQGIFQDLSPAGIRFMTNQKIDLHDIIKIDAPNLQAVAQVTHKRPEESGISAGVRFLTVKFDQRHGNFIAVQA